MEWDCLFEKSVFKWIRGVVVVIDSVCGAKSNNVLLWVFDLDRVRIRGPLCLVLYHCRVMFLRKWLWLYSNVSIWVSTYVNTLLRVRANVEVECKII